MENSEVRPLLVTVDGACEMLCVSRQTLYALIRKGRLLPLKIGARTLFRYDELQRFVDELAVAAEAKRGAK
ncbi:MAG: helix-turn-helix domain-containing protein [Acidothermus sp.]|nr:helix-turn-helix domain-containing protein [Acidothermus sp.]